jgi:hypothetical protein
MAQTMATRATRPTVRPTAAPILRPPALFRETPVKLCALGGTVGVTVTVLTCPVTVSRDATGVGVHVGEGVVPGAGVVSPSDDCARQ